MKTVVVAVLFAFILVLGVDSRSVSLSSSQLTLNGHRYPIINSGDLIALRLAVTSGSLSQRWLYCTTSRCTYTSCHGTHMQSSSWRSCSSYMIFKITAMGKMDGQPINSGDTVTLTIKAYGYTSSYHLRCYRSQSSYCRMYSTTSSMKGNSWLYYYYTTFQIFSRYAVDGTPIQYGDVVGLKFPYGGYQAWLYRYGSKYYSRNCSYGSKTSCAAYNAAPGFIIFKKL